MCIAFNAISHYLMENFVHYLHYLDDSYISFGFLLQPSPHIEMLKLIYSLDKVYHLHQ